MFGRAGGSEFVDRAPNEQPVAHYQRRKRGRVAVKDGPVEPQLDEREEPGERVHPGHGAIAVDRGEHDEWERPDHVLGRDDPRGNEACRIAGSMVESRMNRTRRGTSRFEFVRADG